ncbi:MAG: pyruvate formate lyase-activating protein [Clostridia bacterium]|nr:pyruvate formate lyase-activating protein [Clostridia bacterium]MBR3817724.1 pyruvate formate lyase-activating protein [Clostridia bacterium]
MTGRIHSIQSLAASDGPGLRFAVFMQGCPLRCGCCHNPDTWDFGGGKEYSAEEIIQKASRYKSYFGNKGGITVSGGEPLMQADFVREIFELSHKEGINTCLDTSGCIMNDDIKNLLKHTDRVLLDIKYTDGELYKKHVGCEMEKAIEFLAYLNKEKIPVTLRQVIIPTLNDNEDNVKKLKGIADKYECIDKTELLPFRKLCQIKYDNMGIKFPFADIPEPSKETMETLEEIL